MIDELQHLRAQLVKLEAERNLFERLYLEERQRNSEIQQSLLSTRQQPSDDAQDRTAAALCRLTLKQRASILALVAGHPYAEIAHVLGVNTSTVKLHSKPGFEAFGCQGLLHFKSLRPSLLRQLSKVNLQRTLRSTHGLDGIPASRTNGPARAQSQ